MRSFIFILLAMCVGAYWNDYIGTITENRLQHKAIKSEIQGIILAQRATHDPVEYMALEQHLIDLIAVKDALKHEHFDLVGSMLRPS